MADRAAGPDWVARPANFALAWGLPIAALIVSSGLASPVQTAIWTAALVWMGGACLMNARRCQRRHCFYTGPFFLLMTVPTILHGLDVVSLGPNGWRWLGLAIGVGGGLLWCLPEIIWGKYLARE